MYKLIKTNNLPNHYKNNVRLYIYIYLHKKIIFIYLEDLNSFQNRVSFTIQVLIEF